MKKKQNTIFIILLPLIVIVCGALWLWSGFSAEPITSDDGSRDLKNVNFNSDTFDLYGLVEYIPNALLTPEEFNARQSEIKIGNPTTEANFSTSRMRIFTPDGNYGIMMLSSEYASTIYINGFLTEKVGIPGSDIKSTVSQSKLLYFTAEAENGLIEIVQQASTHVMPRGDTHTAMIIGKPETVLKLYNNQFTFSAGMAFCFLALALAHMILFSLLRSYKANLLFALFCLVWFIRTGINFPWIFLSFLPFDWFATIRLSLLTVPAGTLLLCLTLNALFPGVLQKAFRYALTAACGIYACSCLFISSVHFPLIAQCFYVLILLTVAYIVIRLLMKVRHPRIEQTVILIGSGIFMLGALRDIIPMLFSDPVSANTLAIHPTSEISLLIYVFFQMSAMFYGTMQEIAAAKEAEQKLLSENALLARDARVREEMVRTLSHEVRTPLTVISTYAQLAVRQFRQGKIDEQVIDGLDSVNEEALRLADLARNALSPKEKDQRIADLAEIARQLVRLYQPVAEGADRKIVTHLGERLPVFCDVSEITQVLWNLLDNAFKHGSGDIEVDGNKNDEYVYIIISDYGKGIPPELLPEILTRGVSGAGGSGIGLAIADEIARKHGGKLIIESEHGMGTTATLLLPIIRGQSVTVMEN